MAFNKKYAKLNNLDGIGDYEEIWVERDVQIDNEPVMSSKSDICENDFDDLMSKYATLDNKNDRLNQKIAKEKELENIRQSRELNPNFKSQSLNDDKNSGLSNLTAGDGGASWLRKSFKRAKEQAIERGCSLDQIISERWGSLENFKNLLEEAEKKEDLFLQTKQPHEHKNHSHNYRSNRYNQNRGYDKERPQFVRPNVRDNGHKNASVLHQNKSLSSQPHYDRAQNWRKNNNINNDDNINIHKEIRLEQNQILLSKDHDTESMSEQAKDNNDTHSLYEIYQSAVFNPDQPLTLYTLNKIGAERLRCIINKDQSGQNKWESILKPAREKYLATASNTTSRTNNYNNYQNKTAYQGNRRPGKKNHRGPGAPFTDPDLKTMVALEKRQTGRDAEADFINMGITFGHHQKPFTGPDDELTLDEPLMPSSDSREAKRIKVEMERSIKRGRDHTIKNYKNALSSIENCHLCFDSPLLVKHTVASFALKSYIALPIYTPLVPWECYICPMNHLTSDHDLDTETTSEINNFQDSLCKMFASHGMEAIFLYGCFNTKKFFHYKITCIPLPYKTASQVPMYFKKAIMESEYEWSDNKKIIEILGSDGPQKCVPKGFPYFAFTLGSPLQNGKGYAHVIENKEGFPQSFGKEVIGGIIDADPSLYRKPRNRPFDEISDAMLKFMEAWKPFDFTKNAE